MLLDGRRRGGRMQMYEGVVQLTRGAVPADDWRMRWPESRLFSVTRGTETWSFRVFFGLSYFLLPRGCLISRWLISVRIYRT